VSITWEARRRASIDSVSFSDNEFSPGELVWLTSAPFPQASRAVRHLAKSALREFALEQQLEPPPYSKLEILSMDGPPKLTCPVLTERFVTEISFSHSRTHVACMILIREKS